MKKIAVGKNKFALIDNDHFEKISRWSWHISGGYVVRTGRKKVSGVWKQFPVYLHRLIVGAKKGEVVDHANRNKLDNRGTNLRRCTQSDNLANSVRRKNNKSGYKGVIWDKTGKKWRAGFMKNGRWTHLGMFKSKIAAARNYKEALRTAFGEFART
jgi:hypothetical protein